MDNIDVEAKLAKGAMAMPNLPKSLSLEEKKYLLAIERGDMANVRKMLQRVQRRKYFDINCLDSLGRGALTIAIDQENLEMVELLIIMGVETKDALLQAINVEFVEAVELLLEHEELIHKEGELYSWQKVDVNTALFTPDITPLILAAHRNNYEILKILLDRGATLPMPHDVKCGCDECMKEMQQDSLRHSLSRLNEYKALASPSLIALSSNDPILTAFQLSWELRTLAFAEPECKSEYLELRRQCQQFAVDLLHQSRSSRELAIILNHDPESPPYEEGEHMKLARLELAIQFKQKKFVAHPNIQQLLASIWYEGVPGFRRKSTFQKVLIIAKVALLFPFYSMLYMVAPETKTGKLMRKPFMKFLIHASSYLFFLFVLILVSQRAEDQFIEMFGTESMKKSLIGKYEKQRGNPPTVLEFVVLIYVLGFIYEETHEIYVVGWQPYLRNLWNFIDFTRNFLYTAVFILRVAAYIQQTSEIEKDPGSAFQRREEWQAFDPQLIAEGLFAGANIFSALKLVHLFSINPHLGPLQISLGRMVIDIVKFFFIYTLVLFAFACGLNQLLWYFSDLEKKKCYHLPNGVADFDNAADACMKWRRFANVFESSQSLFWASFGMVDLDSFELTGIKTYTRFWGLLMFGSYSVINVIVLLNLLIAMMSNSYAMIDQHSDTEWKFARTKLWMSYFEESCTLPPPFNIFPRPKMLFKLFGLRKKDKIRRMSSKRRNREEKERDYKYSAVMRALVWRYVSAMHRKCDESVVTEDDVNELKSDISSFRYELMEVLNRNGMDVSSAERKEKAVLGKRMKVWERRLMKDFKVAPIATEEDEELMYRSPPEGEDSLAKFRRIAKLAVLNSSLNKWKQVVRGACLASQIGHCHTHDSFKKQQNLQKAMEEAKKLKVVRSPDTSRSITPIQLPDTTGSSIIKIIKEISPENYSQVPNKFATILGTPNVIIRNENIGKNNPTISISPPQPKETDLIDLESQHNSPVKPTHPIHEEADIKSSLDSFDQIIGSHICQNEKAENSPEIVDKPDENLQGIVKERIEDFESRSRSSSPIKSRSISPKKSGSNKSLDQIIVSGDLQERFETIVSHFDNIASPKSIKKDSTIETEAEETISRDSSNNEDTRDLFERSSKNKSPTPTKLSRDSSKNEDPKDPLFSEFPSRSKSATPSKSRDSSKHEDTNDFSERSSTCMDTSKNEDLSEDAKDKIFSEHPSRSKSPTPTKSSIDSSKDEDPKEDNQSSERSSRSKSPTPTLEAREMNEETPPKSPNISIGNDQEKMYDQELISSPKPEVVAKEELTLKVENLPEASLQAKSPLSARNIQRVDDRYKNQPKFGWL